MIAITRRTRHCSVDLFPLKHLYETVSCEWMDSWKLTVYGGKMLAGHNFVHSGEHSSRQSYTALDN